MSVQQHKSNILRAHYIEHKDSHRFNIWLKSTYDNSPRDMIIDIGNCEESGLVNMLYKMWLMSMCNSDRILGIGCSYLSRKWSGGGCNLCIECLMGRCKRNMLGCTGCSLLRFVRNFVREEVLAGCWACGDTAHTSLNCTCSWDRSFQPPTTLTELSYKN